MSSGRIFANSQVNNFRDYGGWKSSYGGQVVTGKLLRSAHWADAKDQAHELFRELQVQVVVDLRRLAERNLQPNIFPKDLPLEQLVADGGNMKDPPHIQFLREGNLTKNSVQNYMRSAYRRIPIEDHHQQLFRQTILRLGQSKTVLIHCAAGKDRTGILAALILGLLGVSEENIMTDYVLTNKAVDIENKLPIIAKKVSESLGKDIEAEILFPMLGVTEDLLPLSGDILTDPVRYARKCLELDADDLQRLKDNLIC
ncbi:MAG: tyrosine-protein phosphatase [Robiginitomaculum sp.]|nr:tyrosine-protein phosphatase [Robiginitomaculum sp.]